MRILIIAPEAIPVPPVKGGSVEICIEAIARRLAEEHDVTVVGRSHPAYPDRQHQGKLAYIRVKTGAPVQYVKRALQAVGGEKFDIIQIDNRPAFAPYVKQRFPNTPVSVFLHSLTFVSPPKSSRKKALRGLSTADLIIANSSSLKVELSRRFPSLRSRIHRVYLGVDTERFHPPADNERTAAMQRYGRRTDGFNVLFAGRLIPRKGVPLLMKAAAIARRSVPGLRLLIAGPAQRKGYLGKLKRMNRKLKLSAHFIGPVPHRSIHKLYHATDCFICPSQKHEAFGLVNVEAMASGVPCIASAIGGIREIIRSGDNGILVQSYRQPGSFASAIVKLANQRETSQQMAERARRDAEERFSWQSTARKLAALYEGLRS